MLIELYSRAYTHRCSSLFSIKLYEDEMINCDQNKNLCRHGSTHPYVTLIYFDRGLRRNKGILVIDYFFKIKSDETKQKTGRLDDGGEVSLSRYY